MVRRMFRRGLQLGLLVAVIAVLVKIVQSQREEPAGDGWPTADKDWNPPAPVTKPAPVAKAEPVTKPAPVAAESAPEPPKAVEPPAAAAPMVAKSPVKPAVEAPKAEKPKRVAKKAQTLWVEPVGTTCPASHPVKVKLASKIFHLPGMFAYERTRPDRCYGDADAAITDGFTRAKR